MTAAAKHTPGPWSVTRDPMNPNPRVVAGSKIVTVVSEGVAFAKETDGNARLIAAAPELLEALRELRESNTALREALDEAKDALIDIDPRVNGWCRTISASLPVGMKARAAIAKAEA